MKYLPLDVKQQSINQSFEMPVPSQDHCGYQLSGGVILILPYVLWTLICSVIVLYTLLEMPHPKHAKDPL